MQTLKKNSSCRFCGVNFTSGGGRASFENLFSPSGRVESAGLNSAHCCGSILGLQPRDKAAMLGVKTKEYFLEEFTRK